MTSHIKTIAAGLMLTTGLALTNAQAASVKLELFQTKPEAVATIDKLIEKFEAENPDIDIEQLQMPDPGTVLRARIVRNNMPDIVAMGGDSTYRDLANAGMFVDLKGDALIEGVHEAYRKMIADLTDIDGDFGVPYAANANTVLYNVEIFEKLGLSAPTTWSDFIAVAEAVKEADMTPFYHTYLDPWTIMVPFNSLAANIQSDDFIAKMKAGGTSFAEQYTEVGEKLLQLLSYGHNDNFGRGYDDGNSAMAEGKAAMLVQGVWAIPAITAFNPDVKLGVFTMPVSEEAGKSKLVSGVDTLFAISKSGKNIDAAKKFVSFMKRPDIAKAYIDEQKNFSALEGVLQEDPIFEGIKANFESGAITSFPDHYYPAGMQVPNLAQEFLFNEDVAKFLKKLDTEWKNVQARQ